jgi:hypothetical protein
MSASKLSGTVDSKGGKSSSLVLTSGLANNMSESEGIQLNNMSSLNNISVKRESTNEIVYSNSYEELSKLARKYKEENSSNNIIMKTNDMNTNYSEENPFSSLNYANTDPEEYIQNHYNKKNKDKKTKYDQQISTTTKITELKTNDSLYDNENKDDRKKSNKFDKNKYTQVIEKIDECDENTDSFITPVKILSDKNSYTSSSSSESIVEHGPKDHKPKEHKPKEHKPKEHGPKEHKPKEHGPKEHKPKEHKKHHTRIVLSSESSESSDSSSSESYVIERKKHHKKHHGHRNIICDISGNILNGGTTTINNTTNNTTNNSNTGGSNTNSTIGTSGNAQIPTILTGTGNATLVVNTTILSIDQILKIYLFQILKQIESIEFVIISAIKILSEIKRDFLAKINCLEMYSTTSNLDPAEIEYHNNLLNTMYNQLSVVLLQTDSDGNTIFNNVNQTITVTLNLGTGGIYQLFTIDNVYASYLTTQIDVIIGKGDYIFTIFPNVITVSNAISTYKTSFLNVKNAIFALNANKKILCDWKETLINKR